MSGGSFNYVCFKEPLESLEDLRNMESYLRSYNKQLMADEILKYILMIETAKHRLEAAQKYYNDLMYAVEWWASGDWGEDQLDQTYDEMLNIKDKK